MSNKFESCPYCSKTVIKGAMRCGSCGKSLQTSEERIAIIEKLNSKQKFNISRFLKWTVTIIILGVLYYYFPERLVEIIKNTIGI